MKYSKLNKKTPAFLTLFNLIAFILVLFYANVEINSNKIVLYTDSNCNFCEETLDEIEFREFYNHVDLSVKSLNGNSLNKRSFDDSTKDCGITDKEKGVPLLVSDKKCYRGKIEILKELERLTIQN